MSGWIKLHRKLTESVVFDNPDLLKVWLWCLLKATHKEREQIVGLQIQQLEEGQFIFGRKKAAEQLKMSESKTYRLIKRLEMIGNLHIKPNNKYSIITIEKWGDYQSKDSDSEQQNEQQMNNKRTTNEQQMNTNKNVKNVKNVKNNNIPLEISNFRLRYSEFQLKIIDSYFDILKWTRKNGRIADSVIRNIHTEWEKFHPDVVIHSLQIYINNPKYHDKKENYCYGIMRNAKSEDVYKEVGDIGKPKGNNRTSPNTGGASEESLRLERIAKEQGLLDERGMPTSPVEEVDF